MAKRSGLEDPAYAAFAWARYRRILGWMGVVAILFIAGAIGVLNQLYGPLGWVAILAVVGGAGGSIMLAAALMGLVFLSSGSGHDESIDDLE
ncbi:hypothetical protein [Sphingomonas sp. CARO-RG-8B-R24-01]|uniref:hypothetical protein n=1 Tax=Sphingomonas sp. CARO-RG-8B-R24-01 TaxID=2914831 RepID=UPI001F567659|nr:hypothetical protein [Sphingomonas sp. CARO-RG-8B-R24-01]